MKGVVIEPGAHVYPGARIGARTIVLSGAVIYAGARIGRDCRITHGAILREGVRVGDECTVGNHSVILPHAVLERGVTVHSLCLVSEYARVGRGAWLGPGVKLFNTLYPKAPGCGPDKKKCDRMGAPAIGADARIGGNATINPFVKIGAGAVVASGSVVVRDVPPKTLHGGNPARELKRVGEMTCRCDPSRAPYGD